ncbi:hypothetical protein CLV51_11020 [Chitinophaga niastensis]|uniref:Uncharacterized protein n=1 Tax=Chitinophaga niastensis TaxID=536980 RepID=A0A2P8H9C2_CHINA|nr:hypothetical protein [Chitinophaga niastensis]PSL42804.1 hypothetical protein CLV51_11020 [Chitinophaga niastensis]
MNPYISVIFLGILAYLAIHYYEKQNKGRKKAAEIKIKYDEALRGNGKAEALRLGREYYSAIRGKLTIYDEQAITNDLSAMK